MELEALKDYVYGGDKFILEPHDDWKNNLVFWYSKYLTIQCNSQTKRHVNSSDMILLNKTIDKINNAKTIDEIQNNINKLERLGFKGPQTYYNNIKFVYFELESLKATSIKQMSEKFIIFCFSNKMNYLSNPSINNRKRIVSNFIDYIQDTNVGKEGEGAYLFNISKVAIKKAIPKEEKKLIVLSPIKEYAKFLNAIDEIFFKKGAVRNKLMLKILLTTGIRISELLNLTKSDVTIKDKEIHFRIIGKGNKERTAMIAHDNIKVLWKQYAKEDSSNENNYFFCTDKKKQMYGKYVALLIKQVLAHTDIKVTKSSPHMLRHSFACYTYYSVDIGLEELRDLLGHSDISTTQIYLHYFEVNKIKTTRKISSAIKKMQKK